VNIEITDPIGAVIVFAVVLIVAWLVAYSAARTATDDLRTVVLLVAAEDGPSVTLAISNHGMKTAYAVSVGHAGVAVGDALAEAGDVRPGGTATVEIDRGAFAVDSGGPLPEWVRLDWRIEGPRGPQKFGQFPLARSRGGAGA
jgi:uncharacterized protein (TIGR02588 family)